MNRTSVHKGVLSKEIDSISIYQEKPNFLRLDLWIALLIFSLACLLVFNLDLFGQDVSTFIFGAATIIACLVWLASQWSVHIRCWLAFNKVKVDLHACCSECGLYDSVLRDGMVRVWFVGTFANTTIGLTNTAAS